MFVLDLKFTVSEWKIIAVSFKICGLPSVVCGIMKMDGPPARWEYFDCGVSLIH